MIRFDDGEALFNPQSLDLGRIDGCLLIFDDEIWEDVISKDTSLELTSVKNNRGREFNNYHMLQRGDKKLLLAYPAAGAPAAVMELELLIASGVTRFVSFGTCGRLNQNIPENSIIIPTAARREEGTSYHYLPEVDEILQNESYIELMSNLFSAQNIKNISGKIWTTDAVYRETADKVDFMLQHGCAGVDMELSALLAVAKFRGVRFASFLIADDLVEGEEISAPLPRQNEKILAVAEEIVTSL